MLDSRLNASFWSLRLAYGLVPIVAGLDKFTNLLTDWTQYLSPWSPLPASVLMPIVGVIEVAAGLLVLSRFTRLAAYVVTAWLALIAVNLLTTGHFFDVAARDVVLAVGAFTLARLAEVRERRAETAAAAASLRPAHA